MTAEGCEKTVVVVDDDSAIREALADLLGDEGYSVVTAADGQKALDALRTPPPARPCLILLDLMMPVMSGAQFYREQQGDPELKSIPVCVLSADGNVREKAASFGGEYLAKPVRIEDVLTVVERHCKTR